MEGVMAQRKTLNKVQVDVLRWISEDCLDGVVADDVSARISAAALRNRGLVNEHHAAALLDTWLQANHTTP
jgi:hypothetical protein